MASTPAFYTSAENVVSQTGSVQPISHEEVMVALKKQIEYYFSMENLTKDTYLISLMSDSGYVSLETIAGFRKVKELTTNMSDILQALEHSDCVVVDSANLLIKPAISFERKTIILRDVASEATESEIRSLFEGLCTLEIVKREFEGTWFVTVDSESNAIAALDVLRQRSLHDQAIKARLKNESFLKNLLKQFNTSPEGIPAEFIVPAGVQPMMFTPYGMPSAMMPYPQVPMYIQNAPNSVITDAKNKGRKNHGPRKERNGHHPDHPRTYSTPKVLPPILSAEVFPPLVRTSAPKSATIAVKYSKEEIQSIVQQVTDTHCPVMPAHADLSMVIVPANADLVQKGRTVSIDQAMQHGCPRTLSVDSVDYTSMMTGELDEDTAERARNDRYAKKHQPRLNYRNVIINAPAEAVVATPDVATVTASDFKKVEQKNVTRKHGDKKQNFPRGEGKNNDKKNKTKTENDEWVIVDIKKH